MEKKYFLKEGHRELKMGEKIAIPTPVETSYGRGTVCVEYEVNKQLLHNLSKKGLLVVEGRPNTKESDESVEKNMKKELKELFTMLAEALFNDESGEQED